jgi:hypothetical protein
MRNIDERRVTRSFIAGCVAVCATVLMGCGNGGDGPELSQGSAGSSARVGAVTQALAAGSEAIAGSGADWLYETCEPGGANLQGTCAIGMVCQTILRGGFLCYQSAANGCPSGMTSYMGVACLDTCWPQTDEWCPFPLACESGGWCVP